MSRLVMVQLPVENDAIMESGNVSVRLSAEEFERWQERSKGKRFCRHDWQPRLSLPVGGLEIIYWDSVKVCNFPAGRFCSKCGKVDFSHSEGATEAWSQQDFEPAKQTL